LLSSLKNIQEIEFPNYLDETGDISVYEEGNLIPFDISRVFVVSGKKGSYRGYHAHKECSQLIICISGKCKIKCDDGSKQKEYILEHKTNGILIPPMIWSVQHYMEKNTKIMVICNQLYDEKDYIKDYELFLSHGSI